MSLRSTTGSMALRCALACNGDVTELSAHVCRTTCEKVPKPRTLFLFHHPSSKVFFRRAAKKDLFQSHPCYKFSCCFGPKQIFVAVVVMEVEEQEFESRLNDLSSDESDEYHEDDLPDLVINAHNHSRLVITAVLSVV